MKTVLVVEDEKAIRQGIAAMVSRAPVLVERVVECRNGLEALEAAGQFGADVVFTDLRMPKMDGFELVRRLRELPDPPLIVVISGHDDFAHAVEMLRTGARDYLLKPVGREQISALLAAFEEELQKRDAKREESKTVAVQVARALMQGDEADSRAVEAIARQYGQLLFAEQYRVVCLPPAYAPPPGLEGAMDMGVLERHRVYVMAGGAGGLPALGPVNAGVSGRHSGLGRLRTGYLQARQARKYACLLGRPVCHGEVLPAPGARESAGEEVGQIIQLLGRGQARQARWILGELLLWAQNGLLAPDAYGQVIENLVDGLGSAYEAFADKTGELEAYRNCWEQDSAFQHYEALSQWLQAFADGLQSEEDNSRHRIQQAVQYIRQHYTEEINMAVVSNQVSMNYSQFSGLFKQHTGQNFQNYLRGLRIGQAKRLLAETNLSIRQVGAQAGFRNEKHFMRAFKQATAVSPGEYRKNMQMGKR